MTNQGSDNVGVLDVNAHAQVSTIAMSSSPFRVVSRSDGRTYVTESGGQLMILNSATNAKVDSIAIDPAANGITFTDDNNTAYVSSTVTGRIQVLDLLSGTVVDSMLLGGTLQDVALSGDESTLYVASEGFALLKLDLASGTVTDTLLIPAFGVMITPDRTMLVVAGGSDIRLVDEATFTVGPVIAVGGDVRRLSFAHGGRIVIAANGGNGTIVTVQ